jgi:hypothetical protein
MKKVFLVFALAAGMTAVKAQDAKPVSFGVKAGLNLANIESKNDDESESGDMKFGFHVGGFARFALSQSIMFSPELLFSTQGSRDEDEEFDIKSVLKLNYIQLPLMLQYQTASGFYAEVGPGFGFLMGAKSKFELGDEEEEEDVKEFFSGLDINGNIGVGFNLANGLGFGARFSKGFSNIIHEDYREDGEKATNSVFQISLKKSF